MSTRKVNILMVDDQPAKLLSYEAILDELGENLIKANSGREALEQLLKTDIAVVLMDVSMPELDGFELADMIRQHPRFQKTADHLYFRRAPDRSWTGSKDIDAGPWTTFPFRLFRSSCEPKSASSRSCIARRRQLESLNRELRRLSREPDRDAG